MSGIERLQAENEALRATIREAHEVIKDLRTEIRNAKAAERELVASLTEAWGSGVDLVVKEGLASYEATIREAIADAQVAVYARFDEVADVLLGEDAKTKRRGEPSLVELAERIKRRNT